MGRLELMMEMGTMKTMKQWNNGTMETKEAKLRLALFSITMETMENFCDQITLRIHSSNRNNNKSKMEGKEEEVTRGEQEEKKPVAKSTLIQA